MSDAEIYDYVVVGGGSAGCVVAARLSEDPDVSVALIEAGPPATGRLFEIPALVSRQLKSAYDWDFETEPEPALGRRRTYLPRGRVLGGTSSMNTMLYVRGNRADYDRWRELGADSWGYDDVLPFFRKSEDNERGETKFHGVGGPLSVSDARSVHSLLDAGIAAAEQAGHPRNNDFNGSEQEDLGIYQLTRRNGLRCSAANAFIEPAESRPNLHVFPSTLALRILWNGPRAAGLHVDHLSETRTMRVDRDIILSAGAYQSPHLLLLSGVGPADELESFGIHPVADLPEVGRNLQEHVGSLLAFPTSTQHPLLFGDTSAEEEQLRKIGRGPMAWTEAGGFIRSRPELAAPDLQFHAVLGLSYDEGLGPATRCGNSFGPYVARPQSRGWVRLRTSEPYSKPRIFHNFLSVEGDRTGLREGLRRALEISRQPALRHHITDSGPAKAEGFIPTSDTDRALDEFIKQTAFAFYHPCGTCAIGTVVDPQLRVYDLEGIRVGDTSVMPRLITGNTNAPAIMIGERAADFVLHGSP